MKSHAVVDPAGAFVAESLLAETYSGSSPLVHDLLVSEWLFTTDPKEETSAGSSANRTS